MNFGKEGFVEKISDLFERHVEKILFGDDVGEYIHPNMTYAYAKEKVNFIADRLPYRDYDPKHHIYHNSETSGFILEMDPMAGCGPDGDKLMYGLLQKVLPEGAMVQAMLHASAKIGDALDGLLDARKGRGPVLEKMAEMRVKHIKKGALRSLLQSQDYVVRDYKLYITVLFENKMDVSVRKIVAYRRRMLRGLITLGMYAKNVPPESLLSLVEEILYPNNDLYKSKRVWNRLEPLNKQVKIKPRGHKMPSRVTSRRVCVDDQGWQQKCFKLSEYPQQPVFLHQMGVFVGDVFDDMKRLGCPFTISFIVRIVKNSKVKSEIKRRVFFAAQRAKEERRQQAQSLNTKNTEYKEKAAWDDIAELADKKERVVLGSFQVTLYCKEDKSEEQTVNLENIFTPHGLAPWHITENYCLHIVGLYAHLPLVQSHILFNQIDSINLCLPMWAQNAANMFPMLAEIKGHHNHRLLISQRCGQYFYWDQFLGKTNFNAVVAGDSGSGKSVLVNETMCSIIGNGGQCFIVDIGKSYWKLCYLLDGAFCDLKEDENLCFNPFTTTRFSDAKERGEFVAYMTLLVCTMADHENKIINPVTEGMIRDIVQKVMVEKGNEGELQDIIDLMDGHQDSRIKDIAYCMGAWRKDAAWGHYFNGAANIDLKNRLVVFELEGIDEKLKMVIFQVLIYQMTLQMYFGSRDRQITLVVDEAWDVLDSPLGQKTGNHMVRRARKYGGSLVFASQTIADAAKIKAIISQSYWLLLLMQNASSIDEAINSDNLKITDYQKKLLYSIRTEKGSYSEVFIRGAQGEMCVGRLLLDPYTLMAYSTDAEDYKLVKKYMDPTLPRSEAMAIAIEKAVQEKYHGSDFVDADLTWNEEVDGENAA